MEKNYQNVLDQYKTFTNITLKDTFISFEELFSLMQQSRFILFIYNHNSILSSGVLMDSLCADSTIIGPHKGAFADLAKEQIILTYQHYDDIFSIARNPEQDHLPMNEKKKRFMHANSWGHFARHINQYI